MDSKTTHGLLAFFTMTLAILLLAMNSFAETPNSNNDNNNNQMMYPYGMHRGMGPGNMPYAGPGYMHRGQGGYGGMGYGMGMLHMMGGGMMGFGGAGNY